MALETPPPSAQRSSQHREILTNLLAGGIAGAVSRTTVSPLERLKIIFQVGGRWLLPLQVQSRSQHRSLLQTLVSIGKTDGWRGYFRGNGTNVIRMIPYSAIQYASFEFFKSILLRLPPGQDSSCARERGWLPARVLGSARSHPHTRST